MRQAKQLVDELVDEQLVIRDGHGKLQPTTALMGIRELGTVKAGFPSPAEEELADTITLDEWLIKANSNLSPQSKWRINDRCWNSSG